MLRKCHQMRKDIKLLKFLKLGKLGEDGAEHQKYLNTAFFKLVVDCQFLLN